MTDKPTPTDAELKAMWQLHAADIGGIFYYARAVLAKWGQPAQAAEPVAWAATSEDGVVEALGMNQSRRFDTPLYLAPQSVAREPLTEVHIQDLLMCGNPTDEEMRLIRIGWDAARGIKGVQHGDATPQPTRPDPAYSGACNLATALFKKHFAHLPDYASGQAVWGLFDSTEGVILQIDNMVSGLVQPPTTPQPTQAQAGAVPLTCEWTHNEDDGFWETACGEAWRFDDGGPAENSMHFCHSCGKSLCIKGGQHGA